MIYSLIGLIDIGIMALLILAPVAIFSTISVINGAILTADKRFLLFSSLPVIVPISIIICLAFNIAGDLFYSLLIGTIFGFVLEMAGGTIVLRRLWLKVTEIAGAAQQKLTEMKSGFFPLFSQRYYGGMLLLLISLWHRLQVRGLFLLSISESWLMV